MTDRHQLEPEQTTTPAHFRDLTPEDQKRAKRHFDHEEQFGHGLYEPREDAWQVYAGNGRLTAQAILHYGVTPFMAAQGQSAGCGLTRAQVEQLAEQHPEQELIWSTHVWRRPTLDEMDRLKRTDEGYYWHAKMGGLVLIRQGDAITNPARQEIKGEDGKRYVRKGIPYRAARKPERNAPCPCGTGRKFKHCCGR